MSRRDELMETTKANLINLGASLNPPLMLTMEDKKGDMIEKLLRVEPGAAVISIDNPAGEPAADQPRPERNARDLPRLGRLFDLQGNAWDGDFYQVKVFATEGEQGLCEPQINGHVIRFRRGIEVVIPEPYMKCLETATHKVSVRDPETREVRTLEVQKYPMSVKGPVPGPTRVLA